MEAIWLISGGPLQMIAAKKIKALGYALILSDGAENPVCRHLSDLFLQIDTFDLEGHLKAAEKIQNDFNVKAVLTSGSDCHETVANVASFLRLHHTPITISRLCRNKYETRQRLTRAGLYQPNSYLTRNYHEAYAAASIIGGPFVLKATDNSGSRGFAAFSSVDHFSENDFNYTLRMGTSGAVIIEDCLTPSENEISEASVETLWVDGEMFWINWVDRIFSCDLKFFPELLTSLNVKSGVEIGHINPAKHSFKTFEKTRDSIHKAGKAIGMDTLSGAHILKADIFFSTSGPVILELTPRSSGGWDSSASSPARGADIVGGLIQIALGMPIRDGERARYFTYHEPLRVVAVMSKNSENARDCIGRVFAMESGYNDREAIVMKAFEKLQKGEIIVPV